MVPSEYANFFTTAATSGGALIGLLFVAISLAPERTAPRQLSASGQGATILREDEVVKFLLVELYALR